MERGRGGRGGRGGDAKGGRSSGARGTGVSGVRGHYGAGREAGKPGGSGGRKKKSTSMMRQSTWDRLTGREKMQYGTMSYKKYKADMEAMKAKSNRPQRGGGEGRGKGGGPDR